jgi:hypothetical protein
LGLVASNLTIHQKVDDEHGVGRGIGLQCVGQESKTTPSKLEGVVKEKHR